eukprot:GSChrysophyteH1.ASY1.ANO1.1389.1 assembled CDS
MMSRSVSTPKVSNKSLLSNTIIGSVMFFAAFTLFFMYHNHLDTENAVKEDLLAQINSLKLSLDRHQERHTASAKADANKSLKLKDEEVPKLVKMVSNMKAESLEEHGGIHSRIESMQDKFKAMGEKIMTLEEDIKKHTSALESRFKREGGQISLRGATPTAEASDAAGEGRGLDTILLVIASSQRPQYLRRCLEKVIQYHPMRGVDVVVSVDGGSGANSKARNMNIKAQIAPKMILLNHERHGGFLSGYHALSQHYKWALGQVFKSTNEQKAQIQRAVILEEDLEISPDFFEYFGALAHLLDHDQNLLTVSAWNDNGQDTHVRDPKALYRSDFFPGLGWMMNRSLFEELWPKWPDAYWDDWLREPKQRKGRRIIHPEISRTFHYGKNGVSANQFQSQFMDKMRLNSEFINFSQLDLSYLESENWDKEYMKTVQDSQLVTKKEFEKLHYRVEYKGERGFEAAAHWIGIMDNIKAHVPRTAYKGVVSIWVGDARLHLVPEAQFSS